MGRLASANRFLQHLARYALGVTMLTYGYAKIVRMQFQLSPFLYTRPFSQVSGRGLLWATLGYAPWFQILLGVCEFLPAVLLLFRKTARLGALLMFPLILNVVLFNFALDLWPTTKKIGIELLLLNLYLLTCDWRVYQQMLKSVLHRAVRPRPFHNRFELAAAMIVVFYVIGEQYYNYERNARLASDFVGTRQINGAGSWEVQSLKIDGRDQLLPDRQGKMYFDIWHHVFYERQHTQPCRNLRTATPPVPYWRGFHDRIQRCDSLAEDEPQQRAVTDGTFAANSLEHTFNFEGLALDDGNATVQGTYHLEGSILQMEGVRGPEKIEIALHRLN